MSWPVLFFVARKVYVSFCSCLVIPVSISYPSQKAWITTPVQTYSDHRDVMLKHYGSLTVPWCSLTNAEVSFQTSRWAIHRWVGWNHRRWVRSPTSKLRCPFCVGWSLEKRHSLERSKYSTCICRELVKLILHHFVILQYLYVSILFFVSKFHAVIWAFVAAQHTSFCLDTINKALDQVIRVHLA